jgi:hypothetical protein
MTRSFAKAFVSMPEFTSQRTDRNRSWKGEPSSQMNDYQSDGSKGGAT